MMMMARNHLCYAPDDVLLLRCMDIIVLNCVVQCIPVSFIVNLFIFVFIIIVHCTLYAYYYLVLTHVSCVGINFSFSAL